MKHLAHYVGIGRKVGIGLQFLDSGPETCKVMALELIRSANSVAHLSVIRSEVVDLDPSEAANVFSALEVLTGLATALADEAVAQEIEA
jgi:hypothetical protein